MKHLEMHQREIWCVCVLNPSTSLIEVKFFPEEWTKMTLTPEFAWGSDLSFDLWIQSENK